ncbi:macrophage mannose receptor 1-like [Trichomycterus rosablanca]|uniref:macrophage mannose receptor 1-like n=1 Tax=Trichomycterus rosablanca TaxID=2290929 RepID=UPI002F35A6F2
MELNDLLLFLTGLVPVVVLQPVIHSYHLIATAATWSDAQSYCRTNYDDLASVTSADDWVKIAAEASGKGLAQPAWVGLYTDVDGWRWSYNGVQLGATSYNKWGSYSTMKELCGVIYEDGHWEDYLCDDVNPIICYDASLTGAARFIGVPKPYVTWPEAQTYCRTHHTDMATVTNDEENTLAMLIAQQQTWSWLGLYRDTWRWLDGNNATTVVWQTGAPDNAVPPENCATYQSGGLGDEQCSNTHYFFCHSVVVPKKQQMVKLLLNSDDSVFDPAAQEAILDLVKAKLKEHGVWQNITVTWKLQADENVFTKITGSQ